VVDWERRLLHTSVGKVPATQKRVGYRKDSRLDCGCHHVQTSAPEREMVSLSTRTSIPGGLRFGKEPGVPVCDPVSSVLAHETVAHDEREYTRPS
jgi:hypothetical protein